MRKDNIAHRACISKDNTAHIECPKCGKSAIADVSKYSAAQKAIKLKVNCPCGHTYAVFLERRRFFRKNVELPGFYTTEKDAAKKPMTVTDLSRSGVKFETPDARGLNRDDRITLEFTLDDKHRTFIKKEATVVKIWGLQIGVEFASRDPNNPYDRAYDMAIGFYTFS